MVSKFRLALMMVFVILLLLVARTNASRPSLLDLLSSYLAVLVLVCGST
jgi:hypothetical protein